MVEGMPRNTIAGLAEQHLGSAVEFDKILDFNPGAIPFEFPPQVEMGLSLAKQAVQLTGAKIDIPTADDIKGLATGQISKVLGGLGESGQLLGKLKSTLTGVQGAEAMLKGIGLTEGGQVDEILQSIEWLL